MCIYTINMATEYKSLLSSSYNKLSNSINTYKSSSISKYDVIDDHGNLSYVYSQDNPSPHLSDAMLHDTNYNLIHQNIIYILGTITVATLFITIVIVGKR